MLGLASTALADSQVTGTVTAEASGNPLDGVTVCVSHKSDPYSTAVLEFEDCETGTISYDIPSIGRQGEVPIQRITLDMVSICEKLTNAARVGLSEEGSSR
jgi:hypothetical protein